MNRTLAGLFGAGLGVAMGFLLEGRASSLKDITESVGIFGISGAVSGWAAITISFGQQYRWRRVLVAGVSGALSAGVTALIVGSVYFVLAYPHDGLSILSGIFAGMYAFVGGIVAGGIIGALSG